MSVAKAISYAKIIMSGAHRPHPTLPLEIVGIWYAYNEVSGDASAGYVSIPIAPLPQLPEGPYLPFLDAYFTVTGLDIAQDSAKAMGATLIMYADFPALNTPNSVNSVLSVDTFNTSCGDGYYHAAVPAGWWNWLGRRVMPGGTGSLKLYYESNGNTKGYYFQAQGLLLKTKGQLISEGLW